MRYGSIKAKGEYYCTDLRVFLKDKHCDRCVWFSSQLEKYFFQELERVVVKSHIYVVPQYQWQATPTIQWRMDFALAALTDRAEACLANLSTYNTLGTSIQPTSPLSKLEHIYIDVKGVVLDKKTLSKINKIITKDYTQLRKVLIISDAQDIPYYLLHKDMKVRIHAIKKFLEVLDTFQKQMLT